MGKCPICGREGWLLLMYNCHVCGKEVCYKCESEKQLFKLTRAKKEFLETNEIVMRVCSEECLISFLNEIKTIIDKETHVWSELLDKTLDEAYIKEVLKQAYIYYLFAHRDNKWLKENLSWVEERLTNEELFYVELFSTNQEYKHYSNLLYDELYQYLSYIKNKTIEDYEKWASDNAEFWERAGRYKRAAGLYEDLAKRYEAKGLYEKAREMRDRARQLLHGTRRVVIVDLNKLLEQVKDGGIVVVYRCPNCGGKLEIGKDVSVESLKSCKYCGSAIKAIDLVNFLRAALS